MKPINALLAAFSLISAVRTSECPVHSKIGNAINFARLFKEQADSDWNYQNLQTEFKLRLHQIEPKKGYSETHRIVFEITDDARPKRTWFYLIEVIYDEAEILQRIKKYARIRKYENSNDYALANRVNQLVIDNFFHYKIRALDGDQDGDYSEHFLYSLHKAKKTTCNPLTKMEYDYFYYLYSNYYKKGAPTAWGLIEPAVSH